MKKAIILYILFIFCLTGCSNISRESQLLSWQDSNTTKDGYFWNELPHFNEDELNELDSLQEQLISSTSVSNDKDIFQRYVKQLTLANATDPQILSLKATPEVRARLMKHFIFLALAYNNSEFAFVDKARLASVFEMDYFYFSRNFSQKRLTQNYSDVDKIIARYMLGGLISMQAALLIQEKKMRDPREISSIILERFNKLKYGRTPVFTQIILNRINNLEENIYDFLSFNNSFADSFNLIRQKNIQQKTYPMLLKKDYPAWPIQYSEVMPQRVPAASTVFSVSSGLLTGFFAKTPSNKIIFMSAGHWRFNRDASISRQVDAVPFDSAPSKLVKLTEHLKVFNFSEELVIPTLKVLDFNAAEIAKIKTIIGDNPFASSFTLRSYIPWIDMMIAIPSDALLNESMVNKSDINILAPVDNQIGYFAYSIGMGTAENLAKGDGSDITNPFQKFNEGYLKVKKAKIAGGPVLDIAFFYNPISLKDLRHESGPSTFSMKFGPRCSGAPFFSSSENTILALISGDGGSNNIWTNHFTPNNIALIEALIADTRGLLHIPEADLVSLVHQHMFPTAAIKNSTRENIINGYLK